MRKRYPGKFEGCADDRLAEVLYSMSTNSGCDEECGNVDALGWFGLIIHRKHGYIVSEDSQGLFDYAEYETWEEARKAWKKIVKEYDIVEDYS